MNENENDCVVLGYCLLACIFFFISSFHSVSVSTFPFKTYCPKKALRPGSAIFISHRGRLFLPIFGTSLIDHLSLILYCFTHVPQLPHGHRLLVG
jgi:hypothetical protein